MELIKTQYSELIKIKARELGFDDCGFTNAAELTDDKERLNSWLSDNKHGNMHYMANHFAKRTNPSLLVENARSVIVLLSNYYPKEKPLHDDSPIVARYAYGEDYHHVIKAKLKELFNFIKTEIYPSLEGRFFVDSAPVLERSLAVKAGLGWIGKNTNLIHKRLGSYVFISELIINLELPEDKPMEEACGGCTRCIDACPTKAILSPRDLDARKCISYLTIENRDEIPNTYSGMFNNRVYGCDICQEVCPWTWKSRPHNIQELKPDQSLLELTKKDWAELSQEKYNAIFKKSAIKRAKYSGLRRNIDFLLSKKD